MAVKSKIGSKIRRLRSDRGITQVDLANRLGISASYLNLIEHNQRALTVPLLFKIGGALDVDLERLAEDEETRLIADITDAVKNPVFDDTGLEDDDISDLVAVSPSAARAFLTICRAHQAATDELATLSERIAQNPFLATSTHRLRTLLTSVRSFSEILHDNDELAAEDRQKFLRIVVEESEKVSEVMNDVLAFVTGDGIDRAIGAPASVDELVDFLEARRNYFDELETGARSIRNEAAAAGIKGDLGSGLKQFMDRLGIVADVSGRFSAAAAIAAAYCRNTISDILAATEFRAPETEGQARRYLERYVAAAVLMPYEEFHAAAEAQRYDLERLASEFDVSFEQVCHRVTTLSRPGAQGIPFHFVRVDIAGNVSKRYSASGIRLPRSGGICPRWNVHAAPTFAGRIDVQFADFGDDARYVHVSRAVIKPALGRHWRDPPVVYGLSLGCDVSYAPRLVYADGLNTDNPDAATLVGTNCRVCEEDGCLKHVHGSQNGGGLLGA